MKKLFKSIWEILKDTYKGFTDDKVTKLSGSLAYFTVFSMGPLLVVLISACGLLLGKDAVQGKIYSVMQGFVGKDTAAQLQDMIKHAAIAGHGIIAIVIGAVTLVLGATGIFDEIQDSINTIWGLKPKPDLSWWKVMLNRVLSFSVLISLAFLLLVSLAVTAVIEGLSNHLRAHFPDVTVVLFYIINVALTLVVSMSIFAVIFKVLPDAKIRWRDVWVGAAITTLLFLLGKFGISIYISKTNVGSTYGAAGSLVVLLVWIYYSSIILYIGAEFTKVYAVKFGKPIYPNNYAVTVKTVETVTGGQSVQQKENDKKEIKK